MKIKNDLKNILPRIVEILHYADQNDWAALIENILYRLDLNPNDAVYELMSLYQGSGTLNDLVLYKDKKILFNENEEFNDLITKAYNLCLEARQV